MSTATALISTPVPTSAPISLPKSNAQFLADIPAASARRIAANRRNAEKSTGPKTEEGKAISRGNALKHGLSGEGVVMDGPDELAEFEARVDAWRGSFRTQLESGDPDVENRFREMVLQSTRIERAQRREFELIREARCRAVHSWDADRHLLAANIGATLQRNPGLAIARLCTFLHGVQWLIGEWNDLKAVILDANAVDQETGHRLLDLMGIPRMFRAEDHGFDLPSAIKTIENAVDNLESNRLEPLEELDETEQAAALRGYVPEISREERLNRRYENLAQTRYNLARNEVLNRSHQKSPIKTSQPATPANPPTPTVIQPTPAATHPNSPPPTKSVTPPEKMDDCMDNLNPSPFQAIITGKQVSIVRTARNEPTATLGKMGATLTASRGR